MVSKLIYPLFCKYSESGKNCVSTLCCNSDSGCIGRLIAAERLVQECLLEERYLRDKKEDIKRVIYVYKSENELN